MQIEKDQMNKILNYFRKGRFHTYISNQMYDTLRSLSMFFLFFMQENYR